MMDVRVLACALLFAVSGVYANPYWDKQQVPQDRDYPHAHAKSILANPLKTVRFEESIDVLRIQVDWQENETYTVGHTIIEPSGTKALLARSTHKPLWGSYLGVLKDPNTGAEVYYDSIGTGKEYRKLARAINLRFPVPSTEMIFELYAENPNTGVMELVTTKPIIPQELTHEDRLFPDREIQQLARASREPSLMVMIYAEGYNLKEKNKFWKQAQKAANVLQSEHFPGVEYMNFYAVFNPSEQKLGDPEYLGFPVPEYKSFLGLFYPYWDNFGRWYHIVYPTVENKFRQGLASAPYDYPIVLVNNDGYWGVGNYMSHTAIPAGNNLYFTYLLLHELGHFFGLNEEYEGGGRTELEFAPEIEEPWSQNITFLIKPVHSGLKWNRFVDHQTRIPTPYSVWRNSPPVYGAYKGGYGDSESKKGSSYKPGLNCVMESHANFCAICSQGILDVIHYDLGSFIAN